jgi:hypothetical protein
MRIPIILATAVLVLSGCNAIRRSISRGVGPPGSLPGPTFLTPILTIPSATRRTTPGSASRAGTATKAAA